MHAPRVPSGPRTRRVTERVLQPPRRKVHLWSEGWEGVLLDCMIASPESQEVPSSPCAPADALCPEEAWREMKSC